jgi:hypothetical protein
MFFLSQGVHATISPVGQGVLLDQEDIANLPLKQPAFGFQMVEQVTQMLVVEGHLVEQGSLHGR